LIFLSVGGALASQNGLGDLIPRKFADMSAIVKVCGSLFDVCGSQQQTTNNKLQTVI
jgi:hypothetical protein